MRALVGLGTVLDTFRAVALAQQRVLDQFEKAWLVLDHQDPHERQRISGGRSEPEKILIEFSICSQASPLAWRD